MSTQSEFEKWWQAIRGDSTMGRSHEYAAKQAWNAAIAEAERLVSDRADAFQADSSVTYPMLAELAKAIAALRAGETPTDPKAAATS